ncbi:replication restart helicase PriA [Frigoriflavimonas asaccharolytica]|uniref:Replication restart protein PriA n=1 Tax=Frigoriflavimonas asaccharolytica TaxID=2735899 RepID=A0A8J8GA98_9FLAO|nr:primosomal protein N' [Frigoriflavimonas asaccharolytica]NRS91912.1 primosomal protein N' (replication factor Y) [Frigoriflavimonas asaccharolytica]
MTFAEIILPLHLKGTFTYKIPEDLVEKSEAGMRVLVPFRGKKIYTGIIFKIHQEEPTAFIAKEIISLLDEVAILPKEQLQFWEWVSDYYLCFLGDIYRYSFPSSLKLESETYLKLKPHVTIDFQNLDSNEMYLIQALEVRQLINLTDVEAFIPKKEIVKTIHGLLELQYIEIDEKIAEKYKIKEVSYVKIKPDLLKNLELSNIINELKRAKKQQELFLSILEHQTDHPEKPLRKSTLLNDGLFGVSQVKSLIDKGFVEEYFLEKDRLQSYEGEIEEIDSLSDAQNLINEEIEEAFSKNENVLLHGVTSSGKTHLYLEQIETTINQGKNVLFLLPEIAITKQISQRLEKKYGKKLGFYHQKLTDFERVEVWRKIKNNEIQILIGTRNSLFLPFKNLGLIVVDEEHDTQYRKFENNFFYNGKDSALVLAKFHNANVILGSATPSVESYHLATSGKLKYIYLSERFGNVKLPTFELINFKEEQDFKKVKGNFSNFLITELQKNADSGKQAMILHNRRGFSNVLECETCGYVNYCSNCDVVMTYHKSAHEMKCHYCGQKASKPQFCPKCHGQKLNERGVGVEQIHDELKVLLPNLEIDRMDVDSMRKKFAYEKLYEKIEAEETNIIVGTQMISKGLDFENVDIVAIPKADSLLHIQNFRAEERAYQLILQVAGRAGRVSGKGKVYIQTYNPQHQIFQMIQEENPKIIYDYLLEERKKFKYPPFVKTIFIELKHRKEDKVERSARFLGSVLRKYIPEVCILGPEKSPIAKINTLYQYQILLKLPRSKDYTTYKNFVKKSLEEFDEITSYKTIKKEIYVDF